MDNQFDWDINDVQLPSVAQYDMFHEWIDGHVKLVYPLEHEDAKRHSSGWAMRNTNNHNVIILKKSCLGVLVCSKSCINEFGQKVYLRPAICDKARKKQHGRPCPNKLCSGRLTVVPCRGHCGYPVTHFWRHSSHSIFFQSKGVHDHHRPEPKMTSESRKSTRNALKAKMSAMWLHRKDTAEWHSTAGRKRSLARVGHEHYDNPVTSQKISNYTTKPHISEREDSFAAPRQQSIMPPAHFDTTLQADSQHIHLPVIHSHRNTYTIQRRYCNFTETMYSSNRTLNESVEQPACEQYSDFPAVIKDVTETDPSHADDLSYHYRAEEAHVKCSSIIAGTCNNSHFANAPCATEQFNYFYDRDNQVDSPPVTGFLAYPLIDEPTNQEFSTPQRNDQFLCKYKLGNRDEFGTHSSAYISGCMSTNESQFRTPHPYGDANYSVNSSPVEQSGTEFAGNFTPVSCSEISAFPLSVPLYVDYNCQNNSTSDRIQAERCCYVPYYDE
ncbi:uncharacterized protein LOC129581689 [Paramacrobiotus metropolitanus]|uniref:uncharacterized protein LOC129581689 n=1 Tax=Paramacrobiotus metropolitanus TaxID=2943436 RepID=UPI002445F425|nr:uncharacterized protein LOC129581689 [Paramacrobiotus metropolitanus]